MPENTAKTEDASTRIEPVEKVGGGVAVSEG